MLRWADANFPVICFLNSNLQGLVVRLGGIYGPGRNRLALLLKESGVPQMTENKFVNRIRVQDAASAIELLLKNGNPGEVYLAVDDEPTSEDEFYLWFSQLKLQGSCQPLAGLTEGRLLPTGKKCSNRKLKSLGWRLGYPTFREGYADLLKAAEK